MLEAFEGIGAEGVKGSAGVYGLLPGKRQGVIDKARKALQEAGLIEREMVGKAYVYRAII